MMSPFVVFDRFQRLLNQTAARCTFLNGAASFPILVINVIKKDGTI